MLSNRLFSVSSGGLVCCPGPAEQCVDVWGVTEYLVVVLQRNEKKPSLHETLLCAVGFYWTLFKKHMGFSQITDRPKQLWNCRLSGRLEKHLWVKWNFFCLQAQVNVAQIVSVNHLQWAWMPWSSVRSDPSFQVAVCASRSSQLELGQCEPKQKVKKKQIWEM